MLPPVAFVRYPVLCSKAKHSKSAHGGIVALINISVLLNFLRAMCSPHLTARAPTLAHRRDDKTLEDVGADAGAVFHLVLQLRGGSSQ